MISRALVELFQQEVIASTMAFRGGTALHKLHLEEAARYSEDIDLVQMERGAIGPAIDAIRWCWMRGSERPSGTWEGSGRRLIYRFQSEGRPAIPLRLKIEINTREHEPAAVGGEMRPFAVESRWYTGSADVRTFELAEILGTKLRALYQRRKGRDLFDLACRSRRRRGSRPDRGGVRTLHGGREHAVSGEFERNLEEKLRIRSSSRMSGLSSARMWCTTRPRRPLCCTNN